MSEVIGVEVEEDRGDRRESRCLEEDAQRMTEGSVVVLVITYLIVDQFRSRTVRVFFCDPSELKRPRIHCTRATEMIKEGATPTKAKVNC